MYLFLNHFLRVCYGMKWLDGKSFGIWIGIDDTSRLLASASVCACVYVCVYVCVRVCTCVCVCVHARV